MLYSSQPSASPRLPPYARNLISPGQLCEFAYYQVDVCAPTEAPPHLPTQKIIKKKKKKRHSSSSTAHQRAAKERNTSHFHYFPCRAVWCRIMLTIRSMFVVFFCFFLFLFVGHPVVLNASFLYIYSTWGGMNKIKRLFVFTVFCEPQIIEMNHLFLTRFSYFPFCLLQETGRDCCSSCRSG
jgi:hypothetical protein